MGCNLDLALQTGIYYCLLKMSWKMTNINTSVVSREPHVYYFLFFILNSILGYESVFNSTYGIFCLSLYFSCTSHTCLFCRVSMRAFVLSLTNLSVLASHFTYIFFYLTFYRDRTTLLFALLQDENGMWQRFWFNFCKKLLMI